MAEAPVQVQKPATVAEQSAGKSADTKPITASAAIKLNEMNISLFVFIVIP